MDKLLLLAKVVGEIKNQVKSLQSTPPEIHNFVGEKGDKGADGKNGIDGKNGLNGLNGKDGVDGAQGKQGVSVVDATLDFDNSLSIELSDGNIIDAGQINIPESITNTIQNLKSLSPTSLDGLEDVDVATATNNQVLSYNASTNTWVATTVSSGGSGTVTSIDATVPAGLSISGGPVTTSGTLAITYATGYSIPTNTKQGQWDTAYSWGNHASAGYLTSFTETDPIFVASAAYGITSTDKTHWSTAYSWGDHSAAGYQAGDADLTAIAGLTGTTGLLKKTAANTWTLDTSAYLTSITGSQVTTALGYTPYDSANPSGYTSNTGTVTSVAMTVPTGLSISGSPITTSGTLALSLDTGYSIPTTSSQSNWDTAYSERLQWDGGATNLVAATARTSLGLGTAATTNSTAYATAAQGTNADTAYGWGNHASAGYLTSFTETDPIYTASSWYTTTNNSGNWDTTYSWGNHASAGYLTSSAIGSSILAYDSNLQSFVNTFTLPTTDSTSGYVLSTNGAGTLSWIANGSGGGGSGTVTDVSVVSANGFAGTVATSTTTPAITLSTTVTGMLKGDGTGISAATSGTDYAPATTGSSILYANGSGGFSSVTIGSNLTFSAGTLSATGGGGGSATVGFEQNFLLMGA